MPRKPAPPSPASSLRGKGETLLFIEDNQAVRDVVVRLFQRFDYHALVAPTAADALQLWQNHQPIIQGIVSDCDLGHERTGLDLLREFAAAKPGMVLILASGNLTPALIQQLEQTTAIKCLPKPFQYLDLLELLRAGLDAQARQTARTGPP